MCTWLCVCVSVFVVHICKVLSSPFWGSALKQFNADFGIEQTQTDSNHILGWKGFLSKTLTVLWHAPWVGQAMMLKIRIYVYGICICLFCFGETMPGFVICGLSKTFAHLKDTQKAINNRQRQMFVKRGKRNSCDPDTQKHVHLMLPWLMTAVWTELKP